MRTRLTTMLLVAALAALMLVPAAGATNASESVDGTLTYLSRDTTNGTLRGVNVDLEMKGFVVADIDDGEAGGVVVRLYDVSNSSRTIAMVSLRAGALSLLTPDDLAGTKLTAPIDSVWGTFDYAADGYWAQPRNMRINGGNCERINRADITVFLEDESKVESTIVGTPRGSCDDIRQ